MKFFYLSLWCVGFSSYVTYGMEFALKDQAIISSVTHKPRVCDPCALRHRKCNKKKPCNNCQRSHRECTDQRPRGLPGRPLYQSRVRFLTIHKAHRALPGVSVNSEGFYKVVKENLGNSKQAFKDEQEFFSFCEQYKNAIEKDCNELVKNFDELEKKRMQVLYDAIEAFPGVDIFDAAIFDYTQNELKDDDTFIDVLDFTGFYERNHVAIDERMRSVVRDQKKRGDFDEDDRDEHDGEYQSEPEILNEFFDDLQIDWSSPDKTSKSLNDFFDDYFSN